MGQFQNSDRTLAVRYPFARLVVEGLKAGELRSFPLFITLKGKQVYIRETKQVHKLDPLRRPGREPCPACTIGTAIFSECYKLYAQEVTEKHATILCLSVRDIKAYIRGLSKPYAYVWVISHPRAFMHPPLSANLGTPGPGSVITYQHDKPARLAYATVREDFVSIPAPVSDVTGTTPTPGTGQEYHIPPSTFAKGVQVGDTLEAVWLDTRFHPATVTAVWEDNEAMPSVRYPNALRIRVVYIQDNIEDIVASDEVRAATV